MAVVDRGFVHFNLMEVFCLKEIKRWGFLKIYTFLNHCFHLQLLFLCSIYYFFREIFFLAFREIL